MIYLTVFLGIAFLAAVGFGVYIYYKKQEHTREKFAFAGLLAVAGLITIIFNSISGQIRPWEAAFMLIYQMLGKGYERIPHQFNYAEIILAFLSISGLIALIVYLHRNWNGAISERQYQQSQSKENPSLIEDSFLFVESCIKRKSELIKVYQPKESYKIEILSEQKLAWHQIARELLQLEDSKYLFNEFNDWHEEPESWIGRHRATDEIIVLVCRRSKPDKKDLSNVLEYVEKVNKKDRDLKLIVAIQQENIDEKTTFQKHSLIYKGKNNFLKELETTIFEDYYLDIIDRVERNNLPNSELTIQQTYSISNYKLSKTTEPQTNIEDFLNIWLDNSNEMRQLAILGEYGQGKSTVSLMLSYQLIQRLRKSDPQARIPILIELRGKSTRNQSPNDVLSEWAGKYHISVSALQKLLIAGRLLLIFEGFDEIDLLGDKDSRVRHFSTLWQFARYPHNKILITGRPNFFLDDAELKAALGIQEPSGERHYCEAIYLAPFDIEQIRHSLRETDEKTRNEIITLAQKDQKFHEIISRPSLLYIVSTLWKRENLSAYQGQINSAVVMEKFIRHSYRPKPKEEKFTILNSAERDFFMKGIAVYMLVNQLSNQIEAKQLDEAVRKLIQILPDAVSKSACAAHNERHNLLRERFDQGVSEEDIIDKVKTDVRSRGLLVNDLSRSNTFKFAHKSFMEFLAASVFANHLIKEELEETPRLIVSSLVNTFDLRIRHIFPHIELVEFVGELLLQYYNQLNLIKKESFSNWLFDLIFISKTKDLFFLLDIFVKNTVCIALRFTYIPRLIFRKSIFQTLEKLIATAFIGVSCILSLGGVWLLDYMTNFQIGFTDTAYAVTFFFTLFIYIILVIKTIGIKPFIKEIFLPNSGGLDVSIKLWYQICSALKIEREEMTQAFNEPTLLLIEDAMKEDKTSSDEKK